MGIIRQVYIVSDGTPAGTSVRDQETGSILPCAEVVWEARGGDLPRARVVLGRRVPIEVLVRAEVVGPAGAIALELDRFAEEVLAGESVSEIRLRLLSLAARLRSVIAGGSE